jgi:hypothetical protein
MKDSLQWGNAEQLIAVHRQLPIQHQFLSMNFYLSLHQLKLPWRNAACDERARRNINDSFFVLIAHMNVRGVVLAIVPVEHEHQNPIKHTDRRHVGILNEQVRKVKKAARKPLFQDTASAQPICKPPLQEKSAPVVKPDSSPASQPTMPPISSGVPRRFTGMVATIFSSTSGRMALTISVPI